MLRSTQCHLCQIAFSIRDRRIGTYLLICTFVAYLALLAAVPSSSLAHNGVDHKEDDVRELLLLDSNDPIPTAARIPSAAMQRKDPARKSVSDSRTLRCKTTVSVPALGNACRTRDGLWRVNAGPGSVITHGPDSIDEMRLLESRMNRAERKKRQKAAKLRAQGKKVSTRSFSVPSKSDVVCAEPGNEYHFRVLYVRPTGTTDRSSTIIPKLRTEVYKMSAFLNDEAFRVGGVNRKLRVRCDGSGDLDVGSVVTPTAAGVDNFGTVVTDLYAQGYLSSKTNVLVYYDGYNDISIAAGTGHWTNDDSASTGNDALDGGNLSLEWNYPSSGGEPTWSTLLHEAGHNMGAVQNSAANSSGAGHCNDGWDIMCYDDNGPTSAYNQTVCAQEQFDCNADDYYHPSPAPGSYLATHWNLAHPRNTYIDATQPNDNTAPTVPGTPSVSGRTASSVSLTWGASTDETYLNGYRIYRSTGGGPAVLARTVSEASTSVTDTGLTLGASYSYHVTAWDGRNESGASAAVSATTIDTVAPTQPHTLSYTVSADNTVTLSWSGSYDEQGVASYSVMRYSDTATWVDIASATSTSVAIPSSAGNHYFKVAAVDAAGNRSTGSTWIHVSVPDRSESGSSNTGTTPTGAPRALAADNVRSRSATVTWIAPIGSTYSGSYVVRLNGAAVATTQSTSFQLTGLAPAKSYLISVVADGAASSPLTLRTASDSANPLKPTRLKRKKTRSGAVTVLWNPSVDPDGGAVSYRIQTRRGSGTWRTVTTTSAQRITFKRPAKKLFVRVIAVDDAGRASAPSSAIRAR